MRRNYRANRMACVKMYLIYHERGFDEAAQYADEVFGKNESSNWALKKKFELYPKGGWESDWLTSMYRDLNSILRKYEVIK